MEEKARRKQQEIHRVQTKQTNEYMGFETKTQAALGEFKKSRAAEFEKLVLKFKNKLKELENNQKLEVSNFKNILKGISSKFNL